MFLFSLLHVNCYDLCQIVIAFLKFLPCFIKRSSHSLVSFVYIPKMLNDRIKTFFNSSLHRKPCIWTWWNTHKCIPTNTHTRKKRSKILWLSVSFVQIHLVSFVGRKTISLFAATQIFITIYLDVKRKKKRWMNGKE